MSKACHFGTQENARARLVAFPARDIAVPVTLIGDGRPLESATLAEAFCRQARTRESRRGKKRDQSDGCRSARNHQG